MIVLLITIINTTIAIMSNMANEHQVISPETGQVHELYSLRNLVKISLRN